MIKNKKEILKTLCENIKRRMDCAVIGLSGGVDSAVTACICAKALGNSNVYCYGMPYYRNDWTKYNFNAESIAKVLNVNYKTVPIYDIVEGYRDSILDPIEGVTKEHLVSRIRTNVLYYYKELLEEFSNKKVFVVGTSNLTEMFIGNHIKGGDALGDLFVIGDLYKSEVYEFAQFFAKKKYLEPDLIDYIPTSGLTENKTRQEEIGYTYEQIEQVIGDWKEFVTKPEEKNITELYNVSEMHKFVLESYFSNKNKYIISNIIPLRYIIKKEIFKT